ncbi:hypothetical protein [Mesorhizobium sp. L2C067A000]|uniref:hypothetical protein n=1 Tax=Mesorhizobium sp. L2C067A000 TaxID=1287106 RepID=UPI0003D01ABB|nr:hypothetical protein [Mesorhizobium sp. L2C067A000]ESZ37554.1 hypothetical protein X733_03380 [Mesorhizobium sp. L2C067A000]
MRPFIAAAALIWATAAAAQQLQPVAVPVKAGAFLTFSRNDVPRGDCVETVFGGCIQLQDAIGDNHQYIIEPPNAQYTVNLSVVSLGSFIHDCVVGRYTNLHINDGIYVGQIREDHSFRGLIGIRILFIVPSEVFRDSAAEWDEFEILAAVQVPPGQVRWDQTVNLWILPVNYFRRDRGGINLGGHGPSPDWQFTSLADLDALNGRLEQIQSGVQNIVYASLASIGQTP